MPECKALKTFNSARYGFIRAGSRFSSEKGYAHELVLNGLAQILADPLQPERVQAHPGAPQVKKTLESPSPPPLEGDPPAAGVARPSRLSRAARALTRPTARSSKTGAKP